jgi:uncharacterized protein YllA (UPF0747 family)
MKQKKLREYVRKIISKKLSENNSLTKEGVVDGVLNHISGILKKSNDKRYRASLERISASGPKGKKAVEDLMDKIEAAKDGIKHADELAKRLDIYN